MKRFLNKNKAQIMTCVAFLIVLATPTVTFAGGADLAWETTLETLQQSLQGPVAYFIGIGSILLAAAGWAASEGGSTARKGFQIAMALSVLFNAARFVSSLFGASGGLGI